MANPLAMYMGGNLPPTPVPTVADRTAPASPAQVPRVTSGGTHPYVALPQNNITGSTPKPTPGMSLNQYSPYNVVSGLVNEFSNMDNPYMQNARQRGLETAASRGLLNSSIAAGASQRAALEAISPFVSEGVGLLNQREGRALTKSMQQDNAVLQDWMNSNQFNREFNGALSMMPINNTYQLMQNIMQYGLDNPEVYTPDVISGTSNFFTRNMFDVLSQYFPGLYGGTP